MIEYYIIIIIIIYYLLYTYTYLYPYYTWEHVVAYRYKRGEGGFRRKKNIFDLT